MQPETKKRLLTAIEVLGALILVGGAALLISQRLNQNVADQTILLNPNESLSEQQITMLFEQSESANLPRYSEGEVQNLLNAPSNHRRMTDAEVQRLLNQ